MRRRHTRDTFAKVPAPSPPSTHLVQLGRGWPERVLRQGRDGADEDVRRRVGQLRVQAPRGTLAGRGSLAARAATDAPAAATAAAADAGLGDGRGVGAGPRGESRPWGGVRPGAQGGPRGP